MKPILIVDDSLTVRMDLRDALALAGFETVGCDTLAAAREALARQSFSLVILDVLLPDGDGIGLLREIKAAGAAPPVMLLSSEAEVGDRVRGLKTGADDYVGKPYDTGYILERARHLAGGPETGASPEPKILVIDDGTAFRDELQSLLVSAGYAVTTAGGGDDGLRLASALRPDAVVVNLGLSSAMDGVTVVRRLKQDIALRNIPCLLLTASSQSGEELSALAAGADAYVSRQTETNFVLARISALLRTAGETRDGHAARLLSSRRILTVDDSITFLNELSEELHREGYDVIQARSGKQALELLEVQPVDCILLDLRMPDLSGQETCRIIRKTPEWRNIPLIMLTVVEESEAMVEGIKSGADDYITKSSNFDVVKARVHAQLRRRQLEEEQRAVREQLLEKELEAQQARHAQALAEAKAAMVDRLERKNREMEAFNYAVSHDLRTPLRAIHGYSRILLEDLRDQLPEAALCYLDQVHQAASRMTELIQALLQLSRIERAGLNRTSTDLSSLARNAMRDIMMQCPERHAEIIIADGILADADPRLLRIVFDNLLGNAWKFTQRIESARIEVGAREARPITYFVRDNGAGFDMSKADRLFGPFQRLHSESEFPGTGIGLATVYRIVDRHGGRVWAESAPDQGATFFFTLGST